MNALARLVERNPWWQRAGRRERVVLVAGVAIVAIALLATFVVTPLHDSLAQAPQQRALRKALLGQAQSRLAAITAAKPAAAAPVDARAAIERALDRQGISRADATIDTANARIGVTLPAVRLANAAALMDSLARDGLRVASATLAARADSADLRAEIALVRAAP